MQSATLSIPFVARVSEVQKLVLSTKLLEREGRSTAVDYTITLFCARHRAGSFSLTLVESSGLGDLRHAVGKRIRSPKGFVDSVMSLREWTELDIDYDIIVDEICMPLRKLDPAFANSVVDHVEADRSGAPVNTRKRRA
jgi:hypothetical protein